MSSARSDVPLNSSRRVNSGVRFLLNGKTQEPESVILNLIQAEDLSCVLMLFECYEPCARIES
jgi:hypothetical protein